VQGIFRYALAHLVVLGHLWERVWGHPILHPGIYAVFAFYLLSGYLMALTLNRTYAYTWVGTVRFFGNRALRIFPPYLFVVAATLVLLAWAAPAASRVNPFLRPPDSIGSWLSNVFIFGLGGGLFESRSAAQRLVPPAWSLDVELWFYVAMGLLLARRRWIAGAWLTLSVAYTASLLAGGSPWPLRYVPLAAASLPFSLGACVYHWREPLFDALNRGTDRVAARLAPLLLIRAERVRQWQALVVGLLFVAHALLAGRLWSDPMGAGFYVSLAIAAYLMLCLSTLRVDELPTRLVALDRFLGNLSYPVFLCHWLAAVIVARLAFDSQRPGGSTLFWSSLILVNVVAYGIHSGVERPVERLRNALRPSPVRTPEGGTGRGGLEPQ
jgi:peptidoglycan/LPS O-acetylase OafA/YrhL